MSGLVLGLPSKGRLQAETIAWFAARGLEIAREGSDREYAATLRGVDGVSVVLLSAGEIPRELGAGSVHLGVTGEDMIRERLPDPDRQVSLLTPMGFGHADLVVAVPSFWVDVETVHDLDEVAHDFRQRHGRPLRIASKYPALARQFFEAKGLADYRLVDSQGATEAAPKNLTAEAIVDITTTGATLTANHLKMLSDGLILQSQAMVCQSLTAAWTPTARAALARVIGALGIEAAAVDSDRAAG